MKRIITLLALIAIASSAHAQTDSLVVFDTNGDNLEISIAGFDITLSEEDKTEKPKVNRITTNFIGISLGYNVLTQMPNYGNWAGEQNFMTDNTHGWRLGCEPFSVQVSLDRRRSVFLRAAFNTYVISSDSGHRRKSKEVQDKYGLHRTLCWNGIQNQPFAAYV